VPKVVGLIAALAYFFAIEDKHEAYEMLHTMSPQERVDAAKEIVETLDIVIELFIDGKVVYIRKEDTHA
jgi:predicted PurR-regulated permease PerM